MHGGHHHKHEHHDLNEGESHSYSFGTGSEFSLSNFGKFLKLYRRHTFKSFVLACLVLGRPLLQRKQLLSRDVGLWLALSFFFSMYEKSRKTVRGWIVGMKAFQMSLQKHTTPMTKKFFFKNDNAADRVTLLGGAINMALALGKFGVGIACNSAVLVADAGHSLSDLFSDFITLWAVQIGRQPPDEEHPLGHGKFESVGSLLLSITLLLTGLSVGNWSYEKLLEVLGSKGSVTVLVPPTLPAMGMAAISIFSKEWLFRVTRRIGNLLNSQVIVANAWHHRSDAFSSILSFTSIAVAINFPDFLFIDSAAGLLVAGMICMTGLEILGESVKQLTDTSDTTMVDALRPVAASVEGVVEVKSVRSRSMGSGSIVDVSVKVDNNLSTSAMAALATKVKWKLMEAEPSILAVQVQVDDLLGGGANPICPLLQQQLPQRPISEIQAEAYEFLEKYRDIEVKNVRVHYEDTIREHTEVSITVPPDLTVAQAAQKAQTLEKTMSKALDVHKVSFLLSLSDNAVSPRNAQSTDNRLLKASEGKQWAPWQAAKAEPKVIAVAR